MRDCVSCNRTEESRLQKGLVGTQLIHPLIKLPIILHFGAISTAKQAMLHLSTKTKFGHSSYMSIVWAELRNYTQDLT